jgi:hypothetical protein
MLLTRDHNRKRSDPTASATATIIISAPPLTTNLLGWQKW